MAAPCTCSAGRPFPTLTPLLDSNIGSQGPPWRASPCPASTISVGPSSPPCRATRTCPGVSGPSRDPTASCICTAPPRSRTRVPLSGSALRSTSPARRSRTSGTKRPGSSGRRLDGPRSARECRCCSSTRTGSQPTLHSRNPASSPTATGYLAVSLDVDGFGQLGAWTSTAPQGPWQRAGVVASHTPESSGQLSYDGRIADLPGAGRTVVYSVNDPENFTQNIDLYGGRFVPPAISIP
jgi:hypothetical protein